MKYLSAFALFVLLLVTGCGKDSEQGQSPVDNKNKYAFDSTDIKTTQAANPNESFQFAYKFEKGKKYNYRLTTITKDDQTAKMDSVIKQTATQSIIYLMTITGIGTDADAMELECNISSVKIEAKGGNETISYESGKADSANRAKFADYEAMINSPFSIRIGKHGEIIEIYKADRLLNKYLKLKGFQDSVTAEQRTKLRAEITDGALRQLMMQVFREMPTNTIAKDSSWNKPQPPSQLLAFQINNINVYTVKNLEMLGEDKLAVIDASIKTSFSGKNKVSQGGADFNFRTPVTSNEGKIYFNLSDGLVQKSRTRTKVDIYYEMEANTPQGRKKGSRAETVENVNILELL